jgi:hypothetical protein
MGVQDKDRETAHRGIYRVVPGRPPPPGGARANDDEIPGLVLVSQRFVEGGDLGRPHGGTVRGTHLGHFYR